MAVYERGIMKDPIATATGDASRTPFDDGDLYDLIFGSIRFDLDFYLDLAKHTAGPVLEVACGTGRILIPCLQSGVEIDGLDLYAPMLLTLRRKAERLGLHPRVFQADMRSFALLRQYDLIFIAFNGFVHCLTTDDQIKALQNCKKHLKPGGRLVFNVSYPGAEVWNGPQGTPVLEFECVHPKTGFPVRIYDTRTLNRVEQIQHSQNEIQELDGEGHVIASHRSQIDMRFTYKPEMELLLRVTGFSRWEIYGGFDRKPLVNDHDQMIVFAWK